MNNIVIESETINGQRFMVLSREDLWNLYKDLQTNEEIDGIRIPMNKRTQFIDIIAQYEDLHFKSYHEYNDIDNKMSLNHRLNSIIHEMQFIVKACKNAKQRIDDKQNEGLIHGIKLLTERQDVENVSE